MSWGNKILLTFILFAVLIGTLVYKAINQKFELVSEDYYKQELRYQDKIDGTRNANKIGTVTVRQQVEQISVSLPEEQKGLAIDGEAWFYCAENSNNDRKFALRVNSEGIMTIARTALAKTTYQLKLSWTTGGEKFYNEQKLQVQ